MEMEEISCNLCGAAGRTAEEVLLLAEQPATENRRLARCRRCGLVYVTPRKARRYESIPWEFYEKRYLPRFHRHPRGVESQHERLEAFLGGRPRAGQRLLEVGCGLGHFLAEAQKRGWEAAGLEPSPEAVKWARENLLVEIQPVYLEQASLPGRHYDAVAMFEVLEHVNDPVGHLRRIEAALAPGGVLCLSTPSFASRAYRRLGASWRVIKPRGHVYYFTRETLGRALEQAGFGLAACVTLGGEAGDEQQVVFARQGGTRAGDAWRAARVRWAIATSRLRTEGAGGFVRAVKRRLLG